MAIELATAYVSIVPETSKLEKGIREALNGAGRNLKVEPTLSPKVDTRALKTAGVKAADEFGTGMNSRAEKIGSAVGLVIGKSVGGSIGGVVNAGKWLDTHAFRAIGNTIGNTLRLGILGPLGAITGIVGFSLFKGFERLEKIDTAKYKLAALGKTAEQTKDIIKTITDVVTGTPFALDQAFDIATQAIGANVDDIKRFMTDVADAAGFAGKPLEQLGLVFNQILAKGHADGEDMRQLMEAGIPAKSWIQDSYNLTSDQFEKMQSKGEITMQMLETSIEKHAPGMAKKLGESLSGSIDNLKTAAARAGADIITALAGGDTSNITSGINDLTTKLDALDKWIKTHQPEITSFTGSIGSGFIGAASGALRFYAALERISAWIAETEAALLKPPLKYLLGAMFGLPGELAAFGPQFDTSNLDAQAKASRASAESHEAEADKLDRENDKFKENNQLKVDAAKLTRDLASAEIEVNNNELILKGPTQEQLDKIDQAKFKIEQIPGTKDFRLVPKTDEAAKEVNAWIAKTHPELPLRVKPDFTLADSQMDAFMKKWATLVITPTVNPGGFAPGTSGPSLLLPPGAPNGIGGAGGVSNFPGLGRGGGSSGPGGGNIVAPNSIGGNFIGGGQSTASGAGAGGGSPQSYAQSKLSQYGWGADQWGPLNNLVMHESGWRADAQNPTSSAYGIGQFMDYTWPSYGPKTSNAYTQIDYMLQYIKNRYGSPAAAWAQYYNHKGGEGSYATGGGVFGAGGPRSDTVPAWLSPGEHVLTADDVNALGGQAGVYAMRNALHFDSGGKVPWALKDPRGNEGTNPNGTPEGPGPFGPNWDNTGGWSHHALGPVLGPWDPGGKYWEQGPTHAPARRWPKKGRKPWSKDPSDPWWPFMPGWDKDKIHRWGFADGGEVTDEIRKRADELGIPPELLLAQMGGFNAAQGQQQPGMPDASGALGGADRSQGFIPVTSGANTVPGTSMLSGFLNMGAQAINGLIDQAASMGGGAANMLAPGSGAAVGIGAGIAKRGVSYGFQMAGIGADALLEQIFGLFGGPPRWIGYDYSQFIPQLSPQPVAVTSGENQQQGPQQNPMEAGFKAAQANMAPPMPTGGQHLGPDTTPGQPVPPGPVATPEPTPNPFKPASPSTAAGMGGIQNEGGNAEWWKGLFGFDDGGWLEPGMTGVNMTNRPEPVLSPAQWEAMRNTPAGQPNFGVHVENLYAADAEDVKRHIDSQQRLAMLRYAGRP